jgi:uncharacterized protein (DUF1800 family)
MEFPSRPKRLIAAATLLVATAVVTHFAFARKKSLPTQMDPQKQAVHALNRLTFGPRSGDVQRVMQIGIDKWIDLQLRPEKIDDSALDARLAPFRTLRMGTKEIVDTFPPNEIIKQIADGKAELPRDPFKRAVYEAQVQRYQDQQDRKKEKADIDLDTVQTNDTAETRRREARREAYLKTQELLDLPADERIKLILEMSPEDRRALAATAKGQRADDMLAGMSPKQKETVMALNNPEQVVANELTQAKLIRAIYSERQLDEVMTDFWINHFNIFINKGADRYLLTSYERDAIRPHALGKFEDLLVATAKSPAMMFYLDNWLSVGPNSESAIGVAQSGRGYPSIPKNRPRGKPRKKPSSGLNENYGRELMELHTLSVNGGYTQKDVTEVAKVFTGWTLDPPKKGGDFHYEPKMHEPGNKIVLGHRIKQNGEKEGLEVLHLLARNPNTAHFVSQKLAMRFVSDDPPAALVDRMTQTFLKKDGDIREVLRTLFKSPEFWSPETYRAKVKTPLEFVVSAVRASGADVDDARALVGTLNNMGMTPYGMLPPTGYSMKADTWVNSSALLGRMNFALALSARKVRGVKVDSTNQATARSSDVGSTAATDSQATLAMLENSLLAGDVSKQTHDTISKQLESAKINAQVQTGAQKPKPAAKTNPAAPTKPPVETGLAPSSSAPNGATKQVAKMQPKKDDPKQPPNVATITGLILGSPEFQKR